MANSEPEVDFNFQQVLKSIQAIELKNILTQQQLNTAKSNLEELKKERDAALAKCEAEDFKTSQYKKEISLLDEKIPRKNASIEELTKKIEDNQVQTEDCKWRQTKAKLVLESERVRRQMHQRIMDKRIEEDTPKTEPELEGKSGSQTSATGAERALKKEELKKRKEFLQMEISKMENIMKEKKKLMSDISSEASILKKRNSAVLLRLRRKFQDSEEQRRKLTASLEELREMARRARLPF